MGLDSWIFWGIQKPVFWEKVYIVGVNMGYVDTTDPGKQWRRRRGYLSHWIPWVIPESDIEDYRFWLQVSMEVLAR